MSGIGEAAITAGASAIVKALVEKLFASGGGKASSVTGSGKWHFHWQVNQPDGFEPKTIDDVVRLKVDKKGNVTGSSENPFYGPYTVSGSDTPYALTLAYKGIGGKGNLPGICLIIKSADATEMHGVWWQYESKHSLIGGIVTMKPTS